MQPLASVNYLMLPLVKEVLVMGAEGLEPSRPFRVNGFSFSRSFRYCHLLALRIGLSLYPQLNLLG